MEPGTWIALGALLVAALGALFNIIKIVTERRFVVKKDREDASKAGAEKESIAVHSAESALLMMERLLNRCEAELAKYTGRS